ncbi:unnamed protein product [Paramecium primaurelia]|uniref:Uncharacterized protein n=1 Tax=Paramecium primaurelia TaxID=5886 RepID=A0A8S1MJ48_PARPR|nr:unnamed protein product [Paramecium primaurelia]
MQQTTDQMKMQWLQKKILSVQVLNFKIHGINKKIEEPKIMVFTMNPVMERHKQWLEEFRLQNQFKKHAKEEEQIREVEKYKRVRDLAKKNREMTKQMKEEYKQINELIQKELKNDGPKSKT